MRIYLAGPMSGYPAFNIPAFDRVAALLRGHRHDVVSPAELDGPETRQHLMRSKTGASEDLPDGETWGFYLARDIQLLADDGIKAVVVLPGWEKSRGARLETFVASAILGLPIFISTRIGLVDMRPGALLRAWAGDMWDDVVIPLRGNI
jgi:hypothetical protein